MKPPKVREDKQILILEDSYQEDDPGSRFPSTSTLQLVLNPPREPFSYNDYIEIPSVEALFPKCKPRNSLKPVVAEVPSSPEESDPDPRNPPSSSPYQQVYNSPSSPTTLRSNPNSSPSYSVGCSCCTRLKGYCLKKLSQVSSSFSHLAQLCRFHRKLLLSSISLMISSSGCLIFFPLHLENISRHGASDGYSACLAASTMTTLLLLFNCLFLEFKSMIYKSFSGSVLKPMISWKYMLKVGFCLGLSTLTIFYSWEDDKVPCNFQDPLLGLVIIFAIITHAVSRWKRVGLKRIFAMSATAAGVFISVDYPLVDHHRCRGYYFRNRSSEGLWTWKVHVVWTLAFVVSIWLATVAAFFLESSIPVPKITHTRFYDQEYNAVKLKVINSTNASENHPEDNTNNYQRLSVVKSYKFNPYTRFHLSLISNATLWFSVATWICIVLLFWTEFIPGFGKGVAVEKLGERLLIGFQLSLTTGSSWMLFVSLFLFLHSFTYLIVLSRSAIVAVSVAVLGFPIIGLWWSFFQIRHSLFVWMPIFSGELICATIGLFLILGGCCFLVKYEILYPARLKQSPQFL